MATMIIFVGSVSSDFATSSSSVRHMLRDPLTLENIHCHIVSTTTSLTATWLTTQINTFVVCKRLESDCYCYDIFRNLARISTPITLYTQVNVTKLGQSFFLSVYFFTYFLSCLVTVILKMMHIPFKT